MMSHLAVALGPQCQSDQMSKIKNSGLDQYGAEPFEQQQFGTAGVEWVNIECRINIECRRLLWLK